MKYFVLLAVIVLVWVLLFKGRRKRPPPVERPEAAPQVVAPMVACAHCGLHLPQAEALFDAAGQPYCGQAHRLAGPR